MDKEQVKKVIEYIKDQELEICSKIATLSGALRSETEKLEKATAILSVLISYKDNLKQNEINK